MKYHVVSVKERRGSLLCDRPYQKEHRGRNRGSRQKMALDVERWLVICYIGTI